MKKGRQPDRCSLFYQNVELMPATLTIFKKAGALLADPECQEALRIITGRSSPGKRPYKKYVCMMDFVFCETFREFRDACESYYYGNGPQFKRLLTKQQVRTYEKVLIKILRCAKSAHQHGLKVNWASVWWHAMKDRTDNNAWID